MPSRSHPAATPSRGRRLSDRTRALACIVLSGVMAAGLIWPLPGPWAAALVVVCGIGTIAVGMPRR